MNVAVNASTRKAGAFVRVYIQHKDQEGSIRERIRCDNAGPLPCVLGQFGLYEAVIPPTWSRDGSTMTFPLIVDVHSDNWVSMVLVLESIHGTSAQHAICYTRYRHKVPIQSKNRKLSWRWL